MEKITIKDIARICNVGIGTVSRALNDHPDINPETKAQIQQAMKDYHYVPNNSARNLKRVSSQSVAVIMKGIGNPFFYDMYRVIEENVREQGGSCMLYQIGEQENELYKALELEKEKRLLGVLFLGGTAGHEENEVKKLQIPFVFCTTLLGETVDKSLFSSVTIDDEKESYRMVDYLCRRGHRQIAVLAAPEADDSIGKKRLEGYCRALREHGIAPDEGLILRPWSGMAAYSMENGYQRTRAFLDTDVPFTALYALSDQQAFGAMRALSERGIAIPQDCSVAGFDGLEMGRYCTPSLTTVQQPFLEMGRESVRILYAQMKTAGAHCQKIYPARLLIRESVQ